ncbi:hypothetical protein AMATHDRAFT_64114 [Amanita thiersii Skay4041]|uniref:Uncharacterized protein n=1 Tax=Amanita thiersii Skay4041 TaxID=703135 RepID=A0A2A9NL64_9AGAR|nr:hypothetical protein AMATHDRAFT_64114 [Amanita thiersii Skay4041]
MRFDGSALEIAAVGTSDPILRFLHISPLDGSKLFIRNYYSNLKTGNRPDYSKVQRTILGQSIGMTQQEK